MSKTLYQAIGQAIKTGKDWDDTVYILVEKGHKRIRADKYIFEMCVSNELSDELPGRRVLGEIKFNESAQDVGSTIHAILAGVGHPKK